MKNLIIVFILAFTFSNGSFSQESQGYYSENTCEDTFYKKLHDLFLEDSFSKFRDGSYLETDGVIIEIDINEEKTISYDIKSVRGKTANVEIFHNIFERYLSKHSFPCRVDKKQFILIHYINLYDPFKFQEEDFDSLLKEMNLKGVVWPKMIFIASSTKR